MKRLDWIPAVLRAAGLDVVELPGCYGRGVDIHTVLGIVNHGFGVAYGNGWTDTAFDRMLMSGRSDLPGPLAQLGLDDDGTFVFVADGRCNHNGHGTWGNASIGIEMYGRDRWTTKQLVALPRGNAAILNHLVYPASRAKAHRETDPDRKPDPIGVDMDQFRFDVAVEQDHLDRGTTPDTTTSEEEELLLWLT